MKNKIGFKGHAPDAPLGVIGSWGLSSSKDNPRELRQTFLEKGLGVSLFGILLYGEVSVE